jgi:hypothetical protein
MKNHISESLVKKFGVKTLKFFAADPQAGDPGFPSRIRNTGRL